MKKIPLGLTVTFIAMFLALPICGAWFYRAEEKQMRQEAETNLETVAQLKSNQIVEWRAEQLIDAAVIMESPFFTDGIVRWLSDGSPESEKDLLARLHSLQKHHRFHDVLFVDFSGEIRLSLSQRGGRLHDEALAAVSTAIHQHRPVLSEIHFEPKNAAFHLDTCIPKFSKDTLEPIGAIILQVDVAQFLYPLIQSWPTPSASAETLLVSRDGDTVLFLNDLRHRKDTALKLRIPLSQEDVPAVMAVRGRQGVIQGRDYRGVEVLSVLKAIPDSPWFMVAKIDTEEALAVWRTSSILILALVLCLTAVLVVAVIAAWQHFSKAHYRELFRSEAARREAEERHRVTLMSIGDAVISTGIEGRVVLLNPVAEKLTGWSMKDALGVPVTEVFKVVNEETRRIVEDPVTRILREGKVMGLANHTVLIARDGREYPVADSGAPIRDEAGNITGVVMVFRDQSQERQKESELRALTSRLQALLSAIPNIVMEVDTEKIYTWANRAGLEFFGDDVIGRPADHYFEGEQDTYRAVEPLFGGEEPVIYLESRQRRRDGEKRLLGWWCRVLKDELGKEVGALSSAQDMTDLVKTQKEASRLAEAVRQASEGVSIVSLEGMIEYINPAFELITGYSAQEAIGQNPRILKSGKHDQGFYKTLWDTVLSGSRWSGQLLNKRKDGTIYTSRCSISPVKNEKGELERFIWVFRDVSREIELEERFRQTERLESVGRLAAGVAHDLNNFLAPVLGYSEMLMDELDPAGELFELAGIIKQSAERSRDLIHQLLAFGRKQLFEIKTLDVCRVVDDLQKILKRTIRENINIELHLSTESCKVRADSGQLGQVLVNLAVNAQDAMPKGGTLSIEVSPATLDEEYCRHHTGAIPGNYVMLAVSDTGCGIDPQSRQHIFEPFFTTKKEMGTGLGLATVYGIVKQHGGNIWLYSEPGRGSTFRIYLPSDSAKESSPQTPSRTIDVAGGSETILVVEDNEMTRNLACRVLKHYGYEVHAAANGRAALEVGASLDGAPFLLITDVIMPDMNGKELFALLKKDHPQLKVLFMSGYTANVIGHHGVLDEGVHFLQKPFSKNDLAAKVSEVLHPERSHRARVSSEWNGDPGDTDTRAPQET